MTVRSRFMLAAAVGLWVAHPLLAQEPAPLGVVPGQTLSPRIELSTNQKTANTIADNLRQSAQLKQFNIDVVFVNGTAQLSGSVADQPQKEEALRIVQGVPGVERVLDRLSVGANGLAQTQALGQPAPMQPAQAFPPMPQSIPQGGGMASEPMPMFQGPAPSGYDVNPPFMPPYAWPTYAPYNNYSRVGYPTAYPANAWPFIGPMNPFPKVPLGWRSVKLEWEDGHWWYSKTASNYDWWRVRYH